MGIRVYMMEFAVEALRSCKKIWKATIGALLSEILCHDDSTMCLGEVVCREEALAM